MISLVPCLTSIGLLIMGLSLLYLGKRVSRQMQSLLHARSSQVNITDITMEGAHQVVTIKYGPFQRQGGLSQASRNPLNSLNKLGLAICCLAIGILLSAMSSENHVLLWPTGLAIGVGFVLIFQAMKGWSKNMQIRILPEYHSHVLRTHTVGTLQPGDEVLAFGATPVAEMLPEEVETLLNTQREQPLSVIVHRPGKESLEEISL